MVNLCETCKYKGMHPIKIPCIDCNDGDNWEPMGIEIKLERRAEMLPKPLPIYERTDSRIPERVRISFTDGTSAIYDLHTEQPAPVNIENIKIIRRMKQGYVNQPMRRRNKK